MTMESLNQFARIWGDWVITSSWQVAALVVLVGVVAVFSRRLSARFRYALWLLVLVRIALPPSVGAPWSLGRWAVGPVWEKAQGFGETGGFRIADFGLQIADSKIPIGNPGLGDKEPESEGSGVDDAGQEKMQTRGEIGGSAKPSARSSARPNGRIVSADASAWFFLVWAGGVGAFLGFVILRYLHLVRGLRRAKTVDEGPLAVMVERLALELGRRSAPTLLLSDEIASPFLFGVFRPRIVLPATLPDALSTDEMRNVLLHELSHWKRGDLWAGWGQVVAEALFWFHPFMWLAGARISHERECACDEAVLAHGACPAKPYGESLLKVLLAARGRSQAALGFLGIFERNTRLQNRLEDIMNQETRTHRFGVWSWIAIAALAALLLPMGTVQRAWAKGEKATPLEASVRDLVERFFSAVADGDKEAVADCAAPSARNAIVQEALGKPLDDGQQALLGKLTIDRIVLNGDFALAVTSSFKSPDPGAKRGLKVCHIRLERHEGRWLIDKVQNGPADQIKGRIREFEDWARRQSGGAAPAQSIAAQASAERKASSLPASAAPASDDAAWMEKLTENQRLFVEWTNRQFDRFLDRRDFSAWPEREYAELEDKALRILGGPQNREYYETINTLGAMRTKKAVAPLLAIATDRVGQDCRDNWMAGRALGMIGDKSAVPDLIHLIYHTNTNTHFWAQISLVRLTGQNFGYDWMKWGEWWNGQGGQPPFKPDKIRWWDDPKFDEASTAEALAKADDEFVGRIKGRAQGDDKARGADASTSATASAPAEKGVSQGEPPLIVETSPKVGATEVDPSLKEITVTFDRDMSRGGWSWTGGGPDYPPIPEGQKPSYRGKRTCVLPVKLEPGHYYRVGINSKSHRNFRSADGVPARPSAIYFTTKGAAPELVQKTQKPTVVKMEPANGAKDVHPNLRELRVTFSVPMGGGCSWCGGGEDFPEIPEGQRAHWSDDHKTAILPVKLKPNWDYRLGLNSPSFKNFQSEGGVPLDPVGYSFSTRVE